MRREAQAFSVVETVKVYFRLTKPRVWWLLVFTGITGLVAASNGVPDPYIAVMATLIITLGSAGAETVSNYLERDIDAIMQRTRKRPLPAGQIKPAWKALVFGIALIAASLTMAASINVLAFLFMAFGIFDYVVVYVMYSKRRTPLNIILGSFAGGAPTMAGYVAVSNAATLEAWIMSALVVLWIPSHVWSLALKYRDDYARANIPMLPVVTSERTAIRCIASTAILLVLFSAALYFHNPAKYGVIYVATAGITGALLAVLSVELMRRPDKDNAWRLFKFSSPHLALLFLAIIIDTIF
ncbi:MAG: heme o synthase [Aigarchaeota archaeon]|nr:heme o synthase [Candidatus Pelearchaeum maunauluense]